MGLPLRPAALSAALAAAIALAGCGALPEADPGRAPAPVVVEDGSAARRALNARVLDATVRAVERHFYDRTFHGVDFRAEAERRREAILSRPTEATLYDELNGLLALLDDRHTRALAPQQALRHAQARLTGARSLGWTMIQIVDERSGESRRYVATLRPDGPAARAGVQRGWWIKAVDGEPFDPTADYLEGPRRWTFVDADGRERRLELEAALLPRETGVAERRPDGVLVLDLPAFDAAVADWLMAELDRARSDPPRAIILDLRGNPGGEADATARILGAFFPEPVVFARYDLGPFRQVARRTRRHPAPWTGPVAVLQSGRSASAAEVVAAAFREHGRGPVVGQTSAGGVVAARTFRLPDGGQLGVGFSSFRTGRGAVIEKVGVTPDVFAEPTLAEVVSGRDGPLDRAAEAVLRGASAAAR